MADPICRGCGEAILGLEPHWQDETMLSHGRCGDTKPLKGAERPPSEDQPHV